MPATLRYERAPEPVRPARRYARRAVTLLAFTTALATVLAMLGDGPPPNTHTAQSVVTRGDKSDKDGPRLRLTHFSPVQYLARQDADPDRNFELHLEVSEQVNSDTEATLRIDISQLSGTAVVRQLDERCRHEDGEVFCSSPVREDNGGDFRMRPFDLRPALGSKPGEHATLTVRAGLRGVDDSSTELRTRELYVGEPKLSLGLKGDFKGLRPGSTFTARPVVRNEGNVPAVRGIRVAVHLDNGDVRPRHRNCTYSGNQVSCVFSRALEPGETVTLREPLSLSAPKRQLHSAVRASTYPVGGALDPTYDPESSQYGASQGEGPPLELVESSSWGVDLAKGDSTNFRMELDSYVDLRAVGDSLRGKVGETVRARVEVRGRGPAKSPNFQEDTPFTLRFTAPEGTRVVSGPGDGEQSLCDIEDDGRQASCDRLTHADFELRIERKRPNARGKVEVVPSERYPPHDPKPENDTAAVPLRVTGVSDTERTGSGSPDERSDSRTTTYMGGAAVLLALGFGTRHVIRRRRQAGG
ncbi:hypothetical protein [Streptomyces oceani]|uniref:Gram-positive cocci surface proteins LPxTG domain-containing protein n=1 Tax=Streptomyces oceani TaxID=1075402 RepID=A0A1E7KLJ7_9ACTN|nr:hypothetical protein [Streptomyces oceani]OEV04773.1 hypothetical protein AN216_05740 [Streptomyces oceani]